MIFNNILYIHVYILYIILFTPFIFYQKETRKEIKLVIYIRKIHNLTGLNASTGKISNTHSNEVQYIVFGLFISYYWVLAYFVGNTYLYEYYFYILM